MPKLARRLIAVLSVVLAACAPAYAQTRPTPEQRTSRYFDSVLSQPLLLAAFLRQMPKGADLHMHISGSIYAESYIEWAAKDGLCVERKSMALVTPPCDSADKPPAAAALTDSALYQGLLQSMSMLGAAPPESAHDHFFNAFTKFSRATSGRMGDMLAEILSRAADQNQIYVELMNSPVSASPLALKGCALETSAAGAPPCWDDFAKMRDRVRANGLADIIASARKALDEAEARMRQLLSCGTPQAHPGCAVAVRYLYQGYRGTPREQVFAQFLAGFELVQADPRFVGINFVQPEDSFTSRHDFDTHMGILEYLHAQYPAVHIALHAGELAPGLVPPEDLRNHIRDSVERGHARRIGHGVDVMYERDPIQLLQEMAKRKVLVEICLSSNDLILGVRGAQHPLPLYLRYGVPVTIATDDQGVARSDLSREYQRAVEGYGLKYAEVKRMARMSLEHSFLPGASLWSDIGAARIARACAADKPAVETPSPSCTQFLHASERARLQWKLERQFAAFEAQF